MIAVCVVLPAYDCGEETFENGEYYIVPRCIQGAVRWAVTCKARGNMSGRKKSTVAMKGCGMCVVLAL